MAVTPSSRFLFFNNPLISLFHHGKANPGGDLVLTLSEAKNYLFVMA